MSSSVRVYLVRHGRGQHNVMAQYGVFKDPSLTTEGEEQARELGERFKSAGVVPQLVLSSPLQRATQTALLVFDKSPDILEDARERFHCGHRCNLKLGDPDELLKKHETDEEIDVRARRVLAHIKDLHRRRGVTEVALVTHANFIVAFCEVLNPGKGRCYPGTGEHLVVDVTV